MTFPGPIIPVEPPTTIFDWGGVYQKCEFLSTHGPATYHLLGMKTDSVNFFVSPPLRSRMYVPKFLKEFNLVAAINGDGFVSTKIAGYAASEGKPYGKQGVEGTVYISRDNKFSEVRPRSKDLWNAISYPNRLIKDGEVPKINKSINDVRARTAWGYDKDQSFVYFMCVDGGDYLSQDGLNFPDVAHILLDLGCYQAFMQDGGGSTTMAVAPNQVLNAPHGEDVVPGYEYPMRRVANVLGVRRKGAEVPQELYRQVGGRMIDNHGAGLPVTTIVINSQKDFEEAMKTSDFLLIGQERYEILPLDSAEGHLFIFTDNRAKKGAMVRVKENR